MEHRTPGRPRVHEAGALAAFTGILLFVHAVAAFPGAGARDEAASRAPAQAANAGEGPVEHIRGIYLQRAVEIATVGTRTVRLTRMTRFRRCGRFRGTAEDFNEHLVDVAGREVSGIGFVAGFVNAIEGCAPDVGDGRGPGQ